MLARAGWVQLVAADAVATAASLTEQGDGGLPLRVQPAAARRRASDRARQHLRSHAACRWRPASRTRSPAWRPPYRAAGLTAAAVLGGRSLLPARCHGVPRARGLDDAGELGRIELVIRRARPRHPAERLRRPPARRRRGQPANGRPHAHHAARLPRAAAARARSLPPQPGRRCGRCWRATATCTCRSTRACRPARPRRCGSGWRRGGPRARRRRRARRRERRRARVGQLPAAVDRLTGRCALDGDRRPMCRPRCSTGRATACIRPGPPSRCSSPRPRCARRRCARGPHVRVHPPAGRPRRELRARVDAAGPRRSHGPHARTARSICGTASSCRATPTSRSSPLRWGRSLCSMRRRSSASTWRGRRPQARLRAHPRPRRLRAGRGARLAAEDGTRGRGRGTRRNGRRRSAGSTDPPEPLRPRSGCSRPRRRACSGSTCAMS